jgi:hypothetical protein
MSLRAVVLRRVLVRGVVAASDVAALETQTEVDPGITRSETFFAALRRIRAVIPRATEMSANRLRHHASLR